MPKGPAARVFDMHICPEQSEVGTVVIPHAGGPILGPGASTVKIGGQPAALVGDKAFCVLPALPDEITEGSTTVKIEGKAAVRMGDPTSHEGKILTGFPTVIIGG